MIKKSKLVPYFVVLTFCLINLGIVGPDKENKSMIPFFNWCLFCSSDVQFVKFYEVHIISSDGHSIVLSNKNKRNQKETQNVREIVSLYRQSQLTKESLRKILENQDATISLLEVDCDIHSWFISNKCGPTKLLATYEI